MIRLQVLGQLGHGLKAKARTKDSYFVLKDTHEPRRRATSLIDMSYRFWKWNIRPSLVTVHPDIETVFVYVHYRLNRDVLRDKLFSIRFRQRVKHSWENLEDGAERCGVLTAKTTTNGQLLAARRNVNHRLTRRCLACLRTTPENRAISSASSQQLCDNDYDWSYLLGDACWQRAWLTSCEVMIKANSEERWIVTV